MSFKDLMYELFWDIIAQNYKDVEEVEQLQFYSRLLAENDYKN